MNKTVFLKMLAVAVLTVIILIALAAVDGVLESRKSYREEAVTSIAESYAGRSGWPVRCWCSPTLNLRTM